MGKILLVGRLVARDLRRRPAQAVLLLLAITAATATLTLGLALHGVTSQPYQQTRAATNGPGRGGPARRSVTGSRAGPARSQASAQADRGADPRSGGHRPQRAVPGRGRRRAGRRPARRGAEAEGREQAPAAVDQPKLTAGSWVRPGGVVLERTFAEALGVGVGDRVTLDGRPFTVAGIAVTAASPPYPNLCYGGGGGCSPPGPDTHLGTRHGPGLGHRAGRPRAWPRPRARWPPTS